MLNDRILVVDDDETIREIVCSTLGGAHFQTRQAANGVEALSILESGDEFDLVLSDLMMAEMDGIALLEHAKERYPDMPIVMVTAVHDIQVALQAIRNGAYDYLLKPFEREQLLAHGPPCPGESPPQARKRCLSHQPRGARGRPHPAMENRAVQAREILRHDARSLWAMRSTSRTPRPNTTPDASPHTPSPLRAKWACRKKRSR